ncbi:MAG: response regulator [Thermodesulfobacteriota bacterium]
MDNKVKARKILVVDDEHLILRIITDILTKQGYEVRTAPNYHHAIQFLETEDFSAILTDIRMPEKSGIDLLTHIRELNQDVPVILMTGFASMDSAMEAVKQGAFDYLTKPLDFAKLTKVIKQSIEKFELQKTNRDLMEQLKEINNNLEEKISERSRELKNILNSANEAIITTDNSLIIKTANPKTIEIFGEVCVGKELNTLIKGINFKTIIPKILNNASYLTKHEFQYGDKHLEINLSQFLDYETEEVFGVVAIIDDITDKKKLEVQLLHSTKMSAVGQLAAGIAHEFNNVLSGIVGYTSLAMTRDDIEKIRADLKVVDKASQRAIDIIKKLLTFSKQKEEKYTLSNIDEIIEDAISLVKNVLDKEGIKIVKHYSKVPAVRVNQGEIQQVILNLIINAQHAIMQNKDSLSEMLIGIKTKVEGTDVKIEISDTGVGIPKEIIPKIFDPFFSTKNKNSSQSGSGLGLSVSYAILERHKGSIEVSSVTGEGTTFTIQLPYNQPLSDSDSVQVETTNSLPSNSLESVRKVNVLVVDDEDFIRNLIEESLSDYGHNLTLVNNGADATSQFKNTAFDIIFLDIMLPDINGFELLREIKVYNPSAMVVIITGSESENIADSAIAEGASSFLHKPFTVGQIRNTVLNMLGLYN